MGSDRVQLILSPRPPQPHALLSSVCQLTARPRSPCSLKTPCLTAGEPTGRAHANTAETSQPPWQWQSLSIVRAGPVCITAAHTSCWRSFQQPPPSCILGLLAMWGLLHLPGGASASIATQGSGHSHGGQFAASMFFRTVDSLGKTGDKQSPRGPARGGDGQDSSALLCPALPCRAGPCQRRGPEGPSRASLFPRITETGFYMQTSNLVLEDFMSGALLSDSG